MTIRHELDADAEAGGAWWGSCACGVHVGPFPSEAEALDAAFDHLADPDDLAPDLTADGPDATDLLHFPRI